MKSPKLRSLALSLIFPLFFVSTKAAAQSTPLPHDFTIEGRLYDSTGAALNSSSVDIKLELLVSSSGSSTDCVIYRESFSGINVSSTDSSSAGVFSLRLGSGTSLYPAVKPSFTTLFSSGTFSGNNDDGTSNTCTVTASNGDHRYVRVQVHTSSIAGYETLSPDTRISPVPTALVAESAHYIDGVGTSSLLQVNSSGSNVLTQSNLQTIFSTPNYTTLLTMLSGTSAVKVGSPVASTDAATKNYADTYVGGKTIDVSAVSTSAGNGDTLIWDQAQNKWVAGSLPSTGVTAGTYGTTAGKVATFTVGTDGRISAASEVTFSGLMSGSAAGGDLSGTYPNPTIATSAVTTAKMANDSITAAKIKSTGVAVNQLIITDSVTGANLTYATCTTNQILAWTPTGWGCTTVASLAPVTSVVGKTGAVTLNVSDIMGLGIAATKDYGTAAGDLVMLDATAHIPSALLPTGLGTLTYLMPGTGLTGGPITSTGTLNVDIGTSAGQVLALNGSAQIPAVDGALLKNLNAVKLQSVPVGGSAPSAGQVLGYNGTTAQWEPMAAASGSGDFKADGSVPMTAALRAYGGSASTPGLTFNGNTTSGMYSPSSNMLALSTSGSPRLTIDSAGNIGIGTTNPAFPLEVSGASSGMMNVSLRNITSGGSTLFRAANDANSAFYMGVTGTTFPSSGVYETNVGLFYADPSLASLNIGTEGAKPLKFYTSNAMRLAIDPSGNLGVSTLTPQAALDVNVTGTASAILVPRDSQTNRPPTGVSGMIRYNTTSNRFEGYENGAWVNMTSTGAGTGDFKADGSVSMTGSFKALSGSPSAPSLTFSGNTTSGFYSPSTNTVALATGASARMTVDGSGNVGIGTTSPSVFLDVVKTQNAETAFNITNGNTGSNAMTSINLYNANGVQGSLSTASTSFVTAGYADRLVLESSNNAGGLSLLAGSSTAGDIRFLTGNFTERMRVANNGELGIGTTNPAAILDVASNGTAGSAILVPRDTSGNRPLVGVNGMVRYNTTNQRFEAFEAGAWKNMIAGAGAAAGSQGQVQYNSSGALTGSSVYFASGNLGIGSTAPSYPLDVAGNIRATSMLATGSTLSTPLYAFDSDTTTGLAHGSAGNLALTTNGTAALTVTGLGQVGIGTTAPGADLEVMRPSTAVLQITSSAASSAVGPRLSIRDYTNGNNGNYPRVTFQTARGTMASPGAVQAGDLLGGIEVFGNFDSTPSNSGGVAIGFPTTSTWTSGSTPYAVSFSTTPSGSSSAIERMRVDATGKVGIGTSVPNAQFDVMSQPTATSGAIFGRRNMVNPSPTATSTATIYGDYTNISDFSASAEYNWVGNYINLNASNAQVTTAVGLQVAIGSASGGIVNSTGISMTAISATSAATGLDMPGVSGGSGAVTGIRIGNINGTGTRYSIQTLDTTAPVSFAGPGIVGGDLTVKGHMIAGSTSTPAINVCGSSSVAGNDMRGKIGIAGTITTCSINFATPYASLPTCVVSVGGSVPFAGNYYTAASTTTMTITFSTAPTSGTTFNYICLQ